MFGLIFLGLTTLFSAIGQAKAGNAAKRAGEASQRAAEGQADLLDWNAKVAELQAVDETQRGAVAESRFREGIDLMIGKQRAGQAAGNVDVNYGSAVDVQADAAWLGELDALTIRTNAARQRWGFEVQAQDLKKRAEITRKEGVQMAEAGRQAQTASRWQVAGTIATGAVGAGQLAQSYGFFDRAQPTFSPAATYAGPPIMPAVYG